MTSFTWLFSGWKAFIYISIWIFFILREKTREKIDFNKIFKGCYLLLDGRTDIILGQFWDI